MAKILVVDDVAANRDFLNTILGYASHQVFEASNGKEGLEKARAEQPNLIIADILMPAMDGFEFVRQLRAYPSTAQSNVMFYTAAYHENEVRKLARGCGVVHILVKPSDPQTVLKIVNSALGLSGRLPIPLPTEQFDQEHLKVLTDTFTKGHRARGCQSSARGSGRTRSGTGYPA